MEPVHPWLSLASILNLEQPVAVGVPEIVPVEERVSPAGRLPCETVNVYGLVPPLAVMIWW